MLRTSTRRLLPSSSLFSCTPLLRFDYTKLEQHYHQEAFESLQKFQQSTTYPGSIKAATPGDTACHMSKWASLLEETGDRHYWRPVVDDPQPRRYLTISVRFKESVSVGDRMEQHAHIVQAIVPENATIHELMQSVIEMNDSPYLCVNPFSLAIEGKQLQPDTTIAAAGLTENMVIDAIDDVIDHRLHEEEYRPRHWNQDELSPEIENQAPYAEMKLTENQWTPKRSPNAFRYKGAKPISDVQAKYGLTYGVSKEWL